MDPFVFLQYPPLSKGCRILGYRPDDVLYRIAQVCFMRSVILYTYTVFPSSNQDYHIFHETPHTSNFFSSSLLPPNRDQNTNIAQTRLSQGSHILIIPKIVPQSLFYGADNCTRTSRIYSLQSWIKGSHSDNTIHLLPKKPDNFFLIKVVDTWRTQEITHVPLPQPRQPTTKWEGIEQESGG